MNQSYKKGDRIHILAQDHYGNKFTRLMECYKTTDEYETVFMSVEKDDKIFDFENESEWGLLLIFFHQEGVYKHELRFFPGNKFKHSGELMIGMDKISGAFFANTDGAWGHFEKIIDESELENIISMIEEYNINRLEQKGK